MHLRLICALLALAGGLNSTVCKAQATSKAPAAAPAAQAERPWPLLVGKKFKEGGTSAYLDALLTFEERVEEAKADPEMRDLFYDFYGLYLTLAGEHAAVLENEAAYLNLLKVGVRAYGRKIPEGAQSKDAVEAILEAAGGSQIVMLNEEHRSSVQRAFSNRLLEGLRKLGFTYLALEALADDELGKINERGYPTLDSGLYTRDPAYGDLIRRAVALGFTVIPYDANEVRGPDVSMVEAVNSRERGQAENIHKQTLAKDPTAKVVVIGGRHHISEHADQDGWTPMGSVLKEISGIDPLSVDLMAMVELPGRDPKEYAAAEQRGLLRDEGAVICTREGKPWSPLPGLDITVFHPRTKYVHGRPHWMEMGGLRQPVMLGLERARFTEPVLVQASIPGESERAVPVDHYVLWPGKEERALMLRPGTYRVRVLDRTGKVLEEREVQAPAKPASPE
jgi:hypothetical protein